MARKWESAGAEFLHLVDLDGAISGKVCNLPHVGDIARAINIPVEFGGGVRSMEQISEVLGSDVQRVILGTKACQKEFLTDAVSRFGERIAVGIDAKDGMVAVEGWTRATSLRAPEFAREVESVGVKTVIFTDISADGALEGPDFASIERFVKAINMNVIASGGVSSLDDIRRLRAYEDDGVIGVIVGKALYEGAVDLADAIRIGEEND
jgi:phosphoribosylformimino-5-aminoimidazole carboxamide ribotide isomerase